MILITCADDYLGYCVTSHLSQCTALLPDMRILCQKNNSKQPWLLNFANRGINVCPVNYSHANDLSQAMRNIDQVVLVMSNNPDRVKQCTSICNVAAKSGVKSIIFLSHQGAQSEQHEALYDFGQVENHLMSMQQQQQHMNCVIMRLEFIQQHFHLWSNEVEASGTMTLPLSSDIDLCPIDISDVCAVISAVIIQNGAFTTCLNADHVGQVYTLTGPESVTSKSIVEMMSNATTYKQHRCLMVRPMDTEYYLQGLRRNISFDERLKKERSAAYTDQDAFGYRTKALCLPSDVQIRTFLDYFDWTKKTKGSVCVEHVKFIIKKEPRTLQAYFNENSISFKPKV